jgi:putative oxidoreductase
MKYLPIVCGIVLGLLFVMSGVVVLFKLAPTPDLPEGTPLWHLMAAFVPTGYMTFVKVLEVLGGILVAVPKTRNLGLLVLGPIIVNILAFHAFVTGGDGLFSPMIIGICLLALYLLWTGRKGWCALVSNQS